jgi:hypothetical protein
MAIGADQVRASLQCGISDRLTAAWVIFDRAARRFKSRYVGSAPNSDGIFCAP